MRRKVTTTDSLIDKLVRMGPEGREELKAVVTGLRESAQVSRQSDPEYKPDLRG